ncbi:MAG: YdcF family protein [Hyphomicrobiaceae bacterium]|nr:YdcF family protein [Hyphomicrobiaceae bacterium]
MFFFLSKLLWFFAQPSNVAFVLILVGALLMLTAPRSVLGRRMATAGLLAFVVLGFTPFNQILLAPLESRFQRPDLGLGPPPAGIIILGGAEDGRADPDREMAGLNEAAERYTEGIALARRFPQAKLVFSGGSGGIIADAGAPEAVAARRLFKALGIAPERVVLEERSRNTWENAIFTRAMLDPKPGERWLLVTSAYHTPRAVGCFRKAGLEVEPWPVDFRVAERFADMLQPYPDQLRRVDTAVREWIGLVAYYLTGKSTALFPSESRSRSRVSA